MNINEKSIINKLEANQKEFFRSKLILAGVEIKEQPSKDKDGNIIPNSFIRWIDCLVVHGSQSANINAGIDSGIDKLPLFREYDMSVSYDSDKKKLRIVGIWGVNKEEKK